MALPATPSAVLTLDGKSGLTASFSIERTGGKKVDASKFYLMFQCLDANGNIGYETYEVVNWSNTDKTIGSNQFTVSPAGCNFKSYVFIGPSDGTIISNIITGILP